jgi:hypothetical protein
MNPQVTDGAAGGNVSADFASKRNDFAFDCRPPPQPAGTQVVSERI